MKNEWSSEIYFYAGSTRFQVVASNWFANTFALQSPLFYSKAIMNLSTIYFLFISWLVPSLASPYLSNVLRAIEGKVR